MIYRFFKTIRVFTSREGDLFVYALSYSLLLGLFPVILIALILYGKFLLDAQKLIDILIQFFPKEYVVPFIEYLLNMNFESMISFIISIGIAFYVASKSIYSFMIVSSEVYNVKLSKLWIRVLSIVAFIGICILGFGLLFMIAIFKLPLLISEAILLIIVIPILYYLVSFGKATIQEVLPGSILASLGIFLVGLLYFFFIDNFTTYETIYGPLASLVILLLSVYVIASILYFGFCFNLVERKSFSSYR